LLKKDQRTNWFYSPSANAERGVNNLTQGDQTMWNFPTIPWHFPDGLRALPCPS